jgi:hypothetical protein
VQRCVIKRINLCQVCASNKDARARRSKHQTRATLQRNLSARCTYRPDQPCIKHHHAAAWLRGIWLKPKRDNAVGVTIDSEGGGHLREITENQGLGLNMDGEWF